ncbi:MAG TPA: hypothetical protein PK710_17420, partial [Polyangiaceae bacterium]|nr:hypothetical protein [Polyangiaceae bacterium]
DGSLSPDVLQRLTGGSANAAQESSSGGLMGLLGSIPGVAQVKLALEGVAALKNGDASKVLQLASDLVPVPGVRSALQTASQAVDAVKSAGKTK